MDKIYFYVKKGIKPITIINRSVDTLMKVISLSGIRKGKQCCKLPNKFDCYYVNSPPNFTKLLIELLIREFNFKDIIKQKLTTEYNKRLVRVFVRLLSLRFHLTKSNITYDENLYNETIDLNKSVKSYQVTSYTLSSKKDVNMYNDLIDYTIYNFILDIIRHNIHTCKIIIDNRPCLTIFDYRNQYLTYSYNACKTLITDLSNEHQYKVINNIYGN